MATWGWAKDRLSPSLPSWQLHGQPSEEFPPSANWTSLLSLPRCSVMVTELHPVLAPSHPPVLADA